MMISWMREVSFTSSLTAVGNVAPPRPTTPAVAHGVDEARVIGDLRGLDRVGDGHLTVGLDHDRLAGRTHKLQHGDDLLDRAGNARKYRGRNKSARFSDHLTDVDVIADRNDAVGGLADVHAHRNVTVAGGGILIACIPAVFFRWGICTPFRFFRDILSISCLYFAS